MAVFILTVNARHKAEIEYRGKFRHTIGRINHISMTIRIEIFYTACSLVTQTVVTNFPVFKGLDRYIQYMDTYPHKPIFYHYNSYYG